MVQFGASQLFVSASFRPPALINSIDYYKEMVIGTVTVKSLLKAETGIQKTN